MPADTINDLITNDYNLIDPLTIATRSIISTILSVAREHDEWHFVTKYYKKMLICEDMIEIG